MKKTLVRDIKVFSLKADAIDGDKMAGLAGGMGNLDSWNDVIFPDAFPDEVITDFLSSGFIADAHDWDKIVGMPMVARVEKDADTGLNVLYTECEFHSTPDAQTVKTKCAERIERNLAVGLSVGIGMYESSIKTFPNGAALVAYAEKQGYDMSLFDVEGIKACTTKCRAILRVDKWYEYSPVPLPANPIAWASAMKARMRGETDTPAPAPAVLPARNPAAAPAAKTKAAPAGNATSGTLRTLCKSEYLGDDVEALLTMAALDRLTGRLYYWVFWDCVYYDEIPLEERRATLAAGLGEYAEIVLRVFDAIMASTAGAQAEDDSEDSTEAETPDEALAAIKALWTDPASPDEEELPAGSPFDRQLTKALAAVTSCTQRAQAVKVLRAKDGRALSGARRGQITAQRDALVACLASIDALLAEKQPETHSEVPAPAAADPANLDHQALADAVTALKAKALLRQNQARANALLEE